MLIIFLNNLGEFDSPTSPTQVNTNNMGMDSCQMFLFHFRYDYSILLDLFFCFQPSYRMVILKKKRI